jgi:hypothetical protein
MITIVLLVLKSYGDWAPLLVGNMSKTYIVAGKGWYQSKTTDIPVYVVIDFKAIKDNLIN